MSYGEPLKDTGKPLPLVSLLTKPVMLSISNYAMLALLDMSAMALVPLVWSMPIDLGGLNLSPASIGMWLSGYGCLNGILQFFFPRVVGRLCPGHVVLASMAAYVTIYTMFPFENLAARYISRGHDSANATVWLLVLLQLSSICITDMGFSASFSRPRRYARLNLLNIFVNKGSVFMFIVAAAPKQSFAWRNERPRPDRGCFLAYSRARGRRIAVCVLVRKRCLEREFCLCRTPRICLCCALRRRSAAEAYMEARGWKVTPAVTRIPPNSVFQISESHTIILPLQY
jgi:hypothetical protein